MKKYLCLFLIIFLIFASAMTSCTAKEELAIEAAMIISEPGTFENNNFHISTWEGMKKYCEENDIKYNRYESPASNEDTYTDTVMKAINDGAKLVIMPGYMLEKITYKMQYEHADVTFIQIDGEPNNGETGDDYAAEIAGNTYAVMYAEEQAGFLAGYAAVKEGFRKLGFFGGMSVTTVKRYGYGYIQGAEYACKELGLEEESVEIRYSYRGTFTVDTQSQAKAGEWYIEGTEVIFACGGAMGQSVIQAAESSGKWVIGVDTDQSGESERVITSAVKLIEKSVYDAVKSYYENNFRGGNSVTLDVGGEGVGLTMDTAKFTNFNKSDYDTIYRKLSDNENNITKDIIKDASKVEDIPVEYVNVIYE